ncbi:hypothetical protein [Caballeronia calidae]
MEMLRALIRNGATRGLRADLRSRCGRAAHRAGIGARLELSLGGQSDVPDDGPHLRRGGASPMEPSAARAAHAGRLPQRAA